MAYTLEKLINDKTPLNQDQLLSFLDMVTKRCSAKTKAILKDRLMLIHHKKSYPRLAYRVIIHPDGVEYITGQDTSTEIKALRKQLLEL